MNISNVAPHNNRPIILARLLPVSFKYSKDNILYHSSFYRRLQTQTKFTEVTTVHDFLHNHYASYLRRRLHNKLKYSAIQRSKGIICVSNNTHKDLLKYCPQVAGQKVTVIYNGVSDEYKPLKNGNEKLTFLLPALQNGERFLLFVGARSGYKNFGFTIKTLEALPAYKLVVVGNSFSEAEKKMIGKKTLQRVIIAESISNTSLNWLYNNAHALIYPSSYEGFGIPVAEAMKACCPVLALSNSSIPEIAGNAATLFDALDVYKFVQEIGQLENTDYRNEVIEKGLKNASRFSWKKCVEETNGFYREVYPQAME